MDSGKHLSSIIKPMTFPIILGCKGRMQHLVGQIANQIVPQKESVERSSITFVFPISNKADPSACGKGFS